MKIEINYKELTLTETIERLKEIISSSQQPYHYNNETIYNAINYLNLIKIKTENDDEETLEKYKPITLQEHDAESRRIKAILDTKTNDIYILETTKGFAENMGMSIEDRNVDE